MISNEKDRVLRVLLLGHLMLPYGAIKDTLKIDKKFVLAFDVDDLTRNWKCPKTGTRFSIVYDNLGDSWGFDPYLSETHSRVLEKVRWSYLARLYRRDGN